MYTVKRILQIAKHGLFIAMVLLIIGIGVCALESFVNVFAQAYPVAYAVTTTVVFILVVGYLTTKYFTPE